MLVRIALLAVAWGVLLFAGGTHALLWANVTIIPIDLLCIAYVWRLARGEGGLRTVIRFKPVDLAWGLLACLIMLVLFFAASYIGNLVAYAGPPPAAHEGGHVPRWLGVVALFMPLTIAFAEEMVYRGYGQTRLSALTNRWVGWLLAAVFFGAQHAFLTAPEPRAQLARFITTFLAGLAFGALSWWWRRLTPLVIGHWFVDFLGLGLPLFMAALAA